LNPEGRENGHDVGETLRGLASGRRPDDNAIAASEEVAGFESRLAGVESGLNLLKWMAGFNLAMTAAIVVKLFAV
jgi:hypothetical protein